MCYFDIEVNACIYQFFLWKKVLFFVETISNDDLLASRTSDVLNFFI